MSRLTVLSVLAISLLTTNAAYAVDILYAQQNTTILTYDVDTKTLQATLTGTLSFPGMQNNVQLIPGPNGHFLYIITGTGNPGLQNSLSVYATDSSAAPQSPPVQTLGPAPIAGFTIDPNGRFAYALGFHVDSQGNYSFAIRLFDVDPNTGKLTESPIVQATYSPSPYCGPLFSGFSADGTKIAIPVFCDTPDTESATFSYRTVNPETGDLGPGVEFFSFNDSGAASDVVYLGSQTINDFHIYTSLTSMMIYPLAINPQTPLINCTATMLAACNTANEFWQDRTGLFLLFSTNEGVIAQVDLANDQIVDTGSRFYAQPFFSLDDLIMYDVSWGAPTSIQIYGFNPKNGSLTKGEDISFSQSLWNVFLAQRQ